MEKDYRKVLLSYPLDRRLYSHSIESVNRCYRLLSATPPFETVSGKTFCNIFLYFYCRVLQSFVLLLQAELNKALYELERNGIDPEGYRVWLSR